MIATLQINLYAQSQILRYITDDVSWIWIIKSHHMIVKYEIIVYAQSQILRYITDDVS